MKQSSLFLENLLRSLLILKHSAGEKLIEIYNWTTNPVNNSIIREFLLTHCSDFILPVTVDKPFFLGQENTGYSISTFDCEADTNVK